MAGVGVVAAVVAPLWRRVPAEERALARRTLIYLVLPLALFALAWTLSLSLGSRLPFATRDSVPLSLLAADVLRVEGAASLPQVFAANGFDLPAVADRNAPVPRLYFASLPVDLAALPDENARKAIFLQAALPLILLVNDSILTDRDRLRRLAAILDAGGTLEPSERTWLDGLARRYEGDSDRLDNLLLRVDAVPPSLALAQAAVESGWGTSNPALEGNALFGQMALSAAPGRLRRPAYVVRSFAQLYDSVRAYAENLNTHPAYAEFRRRRGEMRLAEGGLDGDRLAPALLAYSERGEAYVAELRLAIRANGLTRFDGVRLGTATPARLLVPGR